MKRCKGEYLLIKMILLKSLICNGLPSNDYQDYQRKCLPCMHTLHAFAWIFLCHLEGRDSVNFIDKEILVLLLGMRIVH